MFACTFVSVIILAVVCGKLAPVYGSFLCGRTADLGQDGTCNRGKVQSWREGSEKEESADVTRPHPAALQALNLSPPQKLLQHLPGLHYATIPCSFLSDIKGWCEFYWTQNHVCTFSFHLARGWKQSTRGNVKMYIEEGGDDVLHQSVSQQTLSQPSDFWLQGCLAFFTMYRCWGGGRQREERWGGGPVVPWTRSACSPWCRNGNCQLWA